MMGRLLLGLAAVMPAAVIYALVQRLGPRLLEPAPEPPPREEAPGVTRARRRLGSRQLGYARLAGAVIVLALLALAVGRWPARAPGRGGVAPAVEVQLPPPMALKAALRFGADGSGPDQLHDPRDIAVDPAGNVYVADTGNKRIARLSPDGRPQGGWTAVAAGPLIEPSALVVVPDGLVIDDSEAARLHKLGFDGRPVPGFEHDLGLAHPRGLGLGPDGTIYVADTANDRVLKVGPDGAPRGVFDTHGVKLEQPTGVVVDDQGSLYSIEPAARRIQKFGAGGALLANLFLPGSVTVFPPRGAWLPGRGLVVTLPEQNELLLYGPSGAPQAAFVPEGQPALRPVGVAFSPDRQAAWVVWNGSAAVTRLLWP